MNIGNLAMIFFLVALASSACTELHYVSEGSNQSVKMSKQCVQTTFRGTECGGFIAYERKLQTTSDGACAAPFSGHICCQDVTALDFRLLGLEQSGPVDCAKQICKYIEDMTNYAQMLTSGHVCVELSAGSEGSEPSNKISCASDTSLNVQRRYLAQETDSKVNHEDLAKGVQDVVEKARSGDVSGVMEEAGDLVDDTRSFVGHHVDSFPEYMDTFFGVFPEKGKAWLSYIVLAVGGVVFLCCACYICPFICCALDCLSCLCPCLSLEFCCEGICCILGGKD